MLAAPTSRVATTVPAPGVAGYSRGGGGSLGPTLGQRTGSNTSPSCCPYTAGDQLKDTYSSAYIFPAKRFCRQLPALRADGRGIPR